MFHDHYKGSRKSVLGTFHAGLSEARLYFIWKKESEAALSFKCDKRVMKKKTCEKLFRYAATT